jgi:uncharacterized Rmd1/YagE family protein
MNDSGVLALRSDYPGPEERTLEALLSPQVGSLSVRAVCMAERIDTKLIRLPRLARSGGVFRAGVSGAAVVFRYGSIVFFSVEQGEQERFIADISDAVRDPFPAPFQDEEATIRLVSEAGDTVHDGVVETNALHMQKLQIIADVLAKNVKLAHYEARLEETFAQVEPLAAALERSGRPGKNAKRVIQQIGGALLIEQQMVWRMETSEKPDLLWDRPELERLYARLTDEYEVKERHLALEHKLELLSRTATTVLELWQDQRA